MNIIYFVKIILNVFNKIYSDKEKVIKKNELKNKIYIFFICFMKSVDGERGSPLYVGANYRFKLYTE